MYVTQYNRKNYEYLFCLFCSFFFIRIPVIKYKRHVVNALMASVDISHRFFSSLTVCLFSNSSTIIQPTYNNHKSPFQGFPFFSLKTYIFPSKIHVFEAYENFLPHALLPFILYHITCTKGRKGKKWHLR